MKKTFKWALTLMSICCMSFVAVSCGDDDGEGNGNGSGNNGGTTEISIPSSVVNGVRVADVSTDGSDEELPVEIEYNEDGTINQATVQGGVYKFEYTTTRSIAARTGRSLTRIYLVSSNESWEMKNFGWNTDGFLTSYYEEVKMEGEVAKLTGRLTYNAEGRIAKISISGTSTDEGETEHVNANINYTYSGGALTSSSFSALEEYEDFNYTYNSDAHTNTYNIVTPQLGIGMASYSPVLYLLSVAGYIGNASSKLPTSVTEHSYSRYTDGDPDYDESTTNYLSYSFTNDDRIKSITMTLAQYGYSTVFTFNYLGK